MKVVKLHSRARNTRIIRLLAPTWWKSRWHWYSSNYYYTSFQIPHFSILHSFSWTLNSPTSASNNHHHFPLLEAIINNQLPLGSVNIRFSDSNWNPPASFLTLALLPSRILHYQVTPHSLVLNHSLHRYPKIASMHLVLPVYQIKQASLVSRNPRKWGKP